MAVLGLLWGHPGLCSDVVYMQLCLLIVAMILELAK
jgi:hypothetical protein